ncbi:MAG: hypothetical protein Q8922_02235 [Bacteroidota bacterium]|nr:hypothetical protein [Bacteroidota bacterium]MDP4232307.1 hypothetical protein [Bacteroidota bacterium]MDP4241446.1 hypothetical protein [Bacteroidota bacterium]MDP4286730.1 hypothetical protein [Bacteroidota bacterium]
MKALARSITLFIILLAPALAMAQHGGIGVKPRTDLVMLPAAERDSITDEVFARIMDLKRYAESGKSDSAALIIGYFGQKTDTMHWTRTINLQNLEEKARVDMILDKVNKLFHATPESHRKYFAIFKEKSSPGGRKYLYQIEQSDGKHTRMVSWNFYGIGDKLVFGDFN